MELIGMALLAGFTVFAFGGMVGITRYSRNLPDGEAD